MPPCSDCVRVGRRVRQQWGRASTNGGVVAAGGPLTVEVAKVEGKVGSFARLVGKNSYKSKDSFSAAEENYGRLKLVDRHFS